MRNATWPRPEAGKVESLCPIPAGDIEHNRGILIPTLTSKYFIGIRNIIIGSGSIIGDGSTRRVGKNDVV